MFERAESPVRNLKFRNSVVSKARAVDKESDQMKRMMLLKKTRSSRLSNASMLSAISGGSMN